MPLLEDRYQAPRWLRNAHAQTALARTLRQMPPLPYARHRLELSDGDFLDLDTVFAGGARVAILCHGLESCSQAPYVLGLGRALRRRGWDVVAMNFRGCSGEPNRLLRSYHSGVTEDLRAVIDWTRLARPGTPMALAGFSLGGNVVLKQAGEWGATPPPDVLAVAGISVPADLAGCAERFAAPANWFYMKRFLHFLQKKMAHRRAAFPDALDYEALSRARNFHDFDGLYTAPAHGFPSAEAYWAASGARGNASAIHLPALILNAADDPFLTEACHLRQEAERSRYLYAETTGYGGHVGFITRGHPQGDYYQETRVVDFFESV